VAVDWRRRPEEYLPSRRGAPGEEGPKADGLGAEKVSGALRADPGSDRLTSLGLSTVLGSRVLKDLTRLSTRTGTLWVVATPIGNLEDLSPRARQVLETADCILAEDTRHSGQMLSHLGIRRPLLSLHEHNELERVPEVLSRLSAGQNLALISDAGTPLVSDPGYRLVQGAREADAEVRTVPGPSALLAALAVSGMPTDRFLFAGFLPPKPAARRDRLTELLNYPWTTVVYESAHRIEACAEDFRNLAPERRILLGRELTKRFEEYYFGPAGKLRDWLAEDANRLRGEFVLVLSGLSKSDPGTEGMTPEQVRTLEILADALSGKAFLRVGAQLTGIARNRIYAWLLQRNELLEESSEDPR
jgi:16S rRNA (cytidine1402-2'-O)-methyltransferase